MKVRILYTFEREVTVDLKSYKDPSTGGILREETRRVWASDDIMFKGPGARRTASIIGFEER
jgi:hypothetical protein